MLFTLILLTGVIGVLVMTVRSPSSRLRPPAAEVFRCRVGRVTPAGGVHWDRRRCRAFWQHDVLLLRFGRLAGSMLALPVRLPDESLREDGGREPGGLGAAPVRLRLRLDDDQILEVASAATDRTLLVGPFLAAALPGMPNGPREPRRFRP